MGPLHVAECSVLHIIGFERDNALYSIALWEETCKKCGEVGWMVIAKKGSLAELTSS